MRIKIKQERRIFVLSFIVFFVNSFTLLKRERDFFKTYRNGLKKSKIKGEGQFSPSPLCITGNGFCLLRGSRTCTAKTHSAAHPHPMTTTQTRTHSTALPEISNLFGCEGFSGLQFGLKNLIPHLILKVS